jgi:hypothetical protein
MQFHSFALDWCLSEKIATIWFPVVNQKAGPVFRISHSFSAAINFVGIE